MLEFDIKLSYNNKNNKNDNSIEIKVLKERLINGDSMKWSKKIANVNDMKTELKDVVNFGFSTFYDKNGKLNICIIGGNDAFSYDFRKTAIVFNYDNKSIQTLIFSNRLYSNNQFFIK